MADHGTISVLFQILGDRLILGGPGGTTPRDAIRGGRGPLRPNERRLFIMARNAKEKEKRTAFSPNRCCRDIQSRPRQPSDVQRLPVHAKWGPLVAASGLGRRLPRPLLPCTGGDWPQWLSGVSPSRRPSAPDALGGHANWQPLRPMRPLDACQHALVPDSVHHIHRCSEQTPLPTDAKCRRPVGWGGAHCPIIGRPGWLGSHRLHYKRGTSFVSKSAAPLHQLRRGAPLCSKVRSARRGVTGRAAI